MKFKKPLSLLIAAVLLCAFAVPLLETPALAADKEIHETAIAGVYKMDHAHSRQRRCGHGGRADRR